MGWFGPDGDCGCCGCTGECYSGPSTIVTRTVNLITVTISGLPNVYSGAYQNNQFYQVTGLQSFEGTYLLTPNDSCVYADGSFVDPTPFSAVLYNDSNCGPGPYSGFAATIQSVAYEVFWDKTALNGFDTFGARQGLFARFTIRAVVAGQAARSVIYELRPENPGFQCSGGNLQAYVYQDPNPCQGFNNNLITTSSYAVS